MIMEFIDGYEPVPSSRCPAGGDHELNLHSLKRSLFSRRIVEVLRCSKCGHKSKGWYPYQNASG